MYSATSAVELPTMVLAAASDLSTYWHTCSCSSGWHVSYALMHLAAGSCSDCSF